MLVDRALRQEYDLVIWVLAHNELTSMPLINSVPLSFYRGWKSLKELAKQSTQQTASKLYIDTVVTKVFLEEESKKNKKAMIVAGVAIVIILLLAYLTGYTDLEGIN